VACRASSLSLDQGLEPFAPLGIAGIGAAASTIFFSFIGLDAVSTAGEEVENPRRTLPLAIILALVNVTSLYVLVALSAVGARIGPRWSCRSAP
jgi:APA family basic amino acid/polyamine antiporter